MRLSTSTAILHHHFDYALTLTDIPAVIRTAGFDALDWSTWQFCLQGGKPGAAGGNIAHVGSPDFIGLKERYKSAARMRPSGRPMR